MRAFSDRPLREQLRLTALAASATTLATATLFLLGPTGPEVAVPGPLASVHAPLFDRCEVCHTTDAGLVKGALHGIVGDEDAIVQSEKCLACHAFGDHALNPHGWDSETWEAVGNPAALAASGIPGASEGRFTCTTCHHEHRGRERALTRVGDRECQACHQQAFESFEDGHPRLGAYPYAEGGTRIAFDHAEHMTNHFPGDAAAPESCSDCHVSDPAGRRIRVRGFDVSCADCHGAEIRGSGQVDGAGIPFLSLLSLDVMSLEGADLPLGEWPSDSGISETGLSPFLALLLSADPALVPDLRTLAELDPLDLLDATEEELAAVARVAWGTKLLMHDVLLRGHAALRDTLERAIGRDVTAEEAVALLGRLPAELVRDAIRDWFPNLEREASLYRDGVRAFEPDAGGSTGEVREDGAREAWVAGGGWYRREEDFTIRYRPGGHADSFLRGWLELAQGAGAPAAGLFDTLSDPQAVGLCAKCHVPGEGELSWTQVPVRRALTGFSHAPHLVGLGAQGCLSCHDVADAGAASSSGFLPLKHASCTECHSSEGARASCVDCHSYHDHTLERPLPDTPLSVELPPREPLARSSR